MKKILFLIAATLAFAGCSNEESVTPPAKELVTVTLDYGFPESGSMTRAGSDLYNNFYEAYIKTKIVTPPTYSLEFKNKETGAIAEINGRWENKDGIKLFEGEYEITGKSESTYNSTGNVDGMYLQFKENVTINKNTTIINLTAMYDCYMLIFNTENISKIVYTNDNPYSTPITLSKKDNIYYMFLQELLWSSSNNYLRITRTDVSTSKVYLDNIPFEKSKYYYFDDINNSFDVPPMQAGN